MRADKKSIPPYPFLALGMLALVAGLWLGLQRMGWWPAGILSNLKQYHGPLMVSGFLGTLISLERAVALDRNWSFLAPAGAVLGMLLVVVLPNPIAGKLLIALGSIVLLVMMVWVWKLQPTAFHLIMGAGALSWLIGNLLWAFGYAMPDMVLWWMGFPLLTIAGERIELNRMDPPSPAYLKFGIALTSLWIFSVALYTWGWAPAHGIGYGLLGVLALWLLMGDQARRMLQFPGLQRYIGWCLLSGYVWLLVVAVFGMMNPGVRAGFWYDATLHAFFLGFVFGMIFGHAPIIFPVLTGRIMCFRPVFYGPWAILQLSLILRIVSDGSGWTYGRMLAGMGNAAALLWFIGNTISTVVQSEKLYEEPLSSKQKEPSLY